LSIWLLQVVVAVAEVLVAHRAVVAVLAVIAQM
jgi:hypothetical protein